MNRRLGETELEFEARRKLRRENVVGTVTTLVLIAVALSVFFWAPGCSAVSAVRRSAIPPKATVSAGSTSVAQNGEAQTPASARSETKHQSVTLPAGTVVWQDAKSGELRYRLSRDTAIESETRTEQATAPAAFTPPKPPTVAEEADARADFWTTLGYRVGVAIGLAAAIYGMVHAWPMVMWGGVAVGGACLFGLFVKSHPALLLVIGLGVTLKFVGPLLWHTKLKHMPVTSKT